MNAKTPRQWHAVLCALLCALSIGWAHAQPQCLIRYAPSGPIYDYRWQLLALAMAHTADEGPCQLQAYRSASIAQSRITAMVQQGSLDVVSYSSSPDREAHLLPVRIDILRGMLGYRILMIRAAEQARFDHLDAQTLRSRMVLGFNTQWADYPILIANGFQVIGTVGYEDLFAMLAAKRFDALPRGLNEIGPEQARFAALYPGIAAEQHLALFMNYPVYFWVNKTNAALAQRIARGLRAALRDGSFKALFIRWHHQEIARVAQEHRQVIRLRNPQLPAGTPPSDTSWWWSQTSD